MQTVPEIVLATLRELIGTRGYYQATEYEFIEVLEHGPELVLHDCSHAQTIQPDMHGEARRLVDKTHTVPLFSEVSHDLHPVLVDFFSPDIVHRLQQLAAEYFNH